MKIFAAGIATETNTFSPLPTGIDDFTVQRGKDVLMGRILYPSLDLTETWGKQAQQHDCDFVFSLNAWAEPAGVTIKSAYEALRDEMLNDLREAMPVDIVLLMMHGAMVAQGYEDCEDDMIRRVRQVVGTDAVIGVELDLHCHLSQSKIEQANIVVMFKEYPHVDINDRARELFDLALAAKRGAIHPTMELFDCRMVGMYPTSRKPMRGFVDSMIAAEGHDKVLSVSFGHGFQLADLPHVGAKMLVVTDDDQGLAQRVAREFGLRAHELRRQIGFETLSLSLENALSRALQAEKTPVVVADQSDNTGGGAPGDATFALRWLLENRAENVALAIFYDPEVVRIAKMAGAGARLSVRLGGKLGPTSGIPVDLDVTVLCVAADYVHSRPQQSGEPLLIPIGDVASLRCGSLDIVVASKRCQCFSPSVFSDLGIDYKSKHVLIPKSTQHFHRAFAEIASEVLYMAGPGAVAPDPKQIIYRRLDTTRLYPWCENPLEI